MMKSNDRFNWALRVLRIQPREEVLEIGCGTGLAAGMVAERLVSGHITAMDLSAAMISKAKTGIQSDGTFYLFHQPPTSVKTKAIAEPSH